MANAKSRNRICRVVKYIGHYCGAVSWDNPPKIFEGEVQENGDVHWPLLETLKCRMSYCPVCGMELKRFPKQAEIARSE